MKRIFVMVAVVLLICVGTTSWGAPVPELINFQSLLYDDGGNVLQDGEVVIEFRITDIEGNILYQERQTTNVIGGAVSTMIGNGLDENGVPTGGIPLSTFEPGESRYLEVEVDGYPPQGAMEIVSVPYALYAEQAMTVAAGSLKIDHFSEQLLQDLGTEISASGGMTTWDDLGQASGASAVGVQTGFTYSGSTNIQGVLQDFDNAVSQQDSRIDAVEGTVAQEVVNRQAADAAETQSRISADETLQQQLDDKVSRNGDDIGGSVNICGDVNINCGGDLQVGATDVPQAIVQNQTNITSNRSYFAGLKIIAWGTVASNGTLLDGYNVSLSKNFTGMVDIQLTSPPSGQNYLIFATCQSGGVGPCFANSSAKNLNSFTIQTTAVVLQTVLLADRPFDFIVLDLQ